MSPYKAAPKATNYSMSDHLGELVFVSVYSFEPQVQTVNGISDAVRVTVTHIQGGEQEHWGKQFADVRLFNKIVVASLRGSVGDVCLGRIELGQPMPGKNAALLLRPPTPQDIQAADAWIAQHGEPPQPPPPRAPYQQAQQPQNGYQNGGGTQQSQQPYPGQQQAAQGPGQPVYAQPQQQQFSDDPPF